MICITPAATDPYFNIASEEYFLKNFSDDIFMLYINEPSIIVGKHQNTFGEINYRYVRENHIRVVRRLSGGGTVFHDEGNLNFCFIRNGQEGNLIDFGKYIRPVIEVLQKLGVPAEQSGRNDIIIKGLKFSGNAEHVYKKRVLHHGTLLFSSKLGNLRDALKVKQDNFQDKSVKSVRSPVTNITEHLSSPVTIEVFKHAIISHVMSHSGEATFYEFSEKDTQEINRLMNEKYLTWEWNFGYSPKFLFTNRGEIDHSKIEVMLEVEKGTIKKADIKKDGQTIQPLNDALENTLYREEELQAVLKSFEMNRLIDLMF